MSEFGKLIKELLLFETLGVLPLDALTKLRDRYKGNKQTDRVVTGTLVRRDGTPIAGLTVELWDRDLANPDDFLGEAPSNREGQFEILYSSRDAGFADRPDLLFKVYEPAQQFWDQGQPRRRRVLVARVDGPDDLEQPGFDMGKVELNFYDYETDVGFPYTTADSIPRDLVPGAAATFLRSLAKWGAVHDKLAVQVRAGTGFSVDEVQALYPKTQTLTLGKRSSSDEYFGYRILNGFFPAQFKKKPDDESLYLSYRWSEFELNGHLDLPDFAARFEIEGGKLLPHEVTLRFRAPGRENLQVGGAYLPEQKYAPGDDDWERAKRVFRTLYFGIIGQLYGHVALTHFNMEQYAIAMNRNLRKSPLRDILMPHLKEVSNINDKGRTLLLGADEGLFAQAKPIVLSSQLRWLEGNVGRFDWKGWQPRAALTDDHSYARAGALYWEILNEYLGAEFEARRAEFVETWDEAVAFERDLLEHAVEFRARGLEEADDGLFWADSNELADPEARREEANGSTRAISKVLVGEGPTAQSLANLRDLCAYCIFHATFVHGWFHKEEDNEFGEIRYAQLLRNGCFGAEEEVLPDAELLSLGLRTSHSLTDFDWGFMLKNEDGDVPKGLLDALQAREDEFLEAGFPLQLLRSRLNS